MEIPFLDHVRHSLMIDRNKDVIIEKLLSLTLEIVCLLAGEDYVVVRRSTDRCVTEKGGHLASDTCHKAQSLITGGSPRVTEENPSRRTPEPANNVLLAAEKLPIKSEAAEVIAWVHLVEQKDAVVVSRPEPSRSAGDSSPVWQRVSELQVSAPQDSTDPKEDYISAPCSAGSPPRKCRTSLCSQECQAEPLGDGRSHQRCKEEDTAVPDGVGSGRDDSTDYQERCQDPVWSEEDSELMPQEYQSDVRDGIFHQQCKEEDSPDYINSGPAVSSLATVVIHPISLAQEDFPNHSDPVARPKPHGTHDLFSCSICGVRFTSETTFASHQRFHTEEKSYDCTYCGKSFNQRSRLLSHKRKHTGEKPFSCPVCGRCFAERSALITHQRIHSGEKPFNCTECARSFVQRSSLVKHQRIHTGERPFVCTQCGRCFSQSSNLVRHQRILHQYL